MVARSALSTARRPVAHQRRTCRCRHTEKTVAEQEPASVRFLVKAETSPAILPRILQSLAAGILRRSGCGLNMLAVAC